MTTFTDVYYDAPDLLRLHARDYDGGAHPGTPVLCLAGLTRNARDFEALAGRLAAGRRVVVAEQRGRGRSAYDPKPENYHPATYAADMLALLDHLEIGRVAIIGTSLGGLMAMLMAAAWPDRVAGILLNDVGPEVATEGIDKIRAYIDRVPQVTDWSDAANDVRTLFGAVFPDYEMADWQRFARAVYTENAAGIPVLDYDPKIAVNVKNGANAAPDLWPVFDALPPMPVAVIRGALSNILTGATLAEMKKRRPDLIAAEVERVGHAPDLEEPESLALIDRFLAEVDRDKLAISTAKKHQ
jgi:pimeloyl-ACP methyl ester carboxylesterase